MSTSNNIAEQMRQLYTGPAHPFDAYVEDYLERNPTMASKTIISSNVAPDNTWDVNSGMAVGFFVQNETTGALYRCFNATPGSAIWRLMITEAP